MVTKTALISGDQGFVASWMRPALEQAGYEVHGFDIKTGTDARDFFRTNSDYFDLLIHLAAVVGGRAKIEGSPLDLAVDLAIDSEMFQWAQRTKPGKVVYFSSSAAYPIHLQNSGNPKRLIEHDLSTDGGWYSAIGVPDMTYGWAKLTGEMLAEHAAAKGLDVLVVRPFSGYGPDQALDYPFPSFIERARRKADPFEIWGNGMQSRDWIHIEDICGATIRAVDEGIDGPVNLCTGIRTSFNDLAVMVCEAAGYRPEFKHLLDAPRGVGVRVGDPDRMKRFYEPCWTLEQGIEQALKP